MKIKTNDCYISTTTLTGEDLLLIEWLDAIEEKNIATINITGTCMLSVTDNYITIIDDNFVARVLYRWFDISKIYLNGQPASIRDYIVKHELTITIDATENCIIVHKN